MGWRWACASSAELLWWWWRAWWAVESEEASEREWPVLWWLGRIAGALLAVATWWAGPVLAYGHHLACPAWRRSALLGSEVSESSSQCWLNLDLCCSYSPNPFSHLSNQMHYVIELCKFSNFVNMHSLWFGLEFKLQSPKHRYMETVWHLGLRNFSKCWINTQIWLVGQVWDCSTHYHDLASKQSLFLI